MGHTVKYNYIKVNYNDIRKICGNRLAVEEFVNRVYMLMLALLSDTLIQ